MFMKIFWAQRVVCPCPGAIYMYMTIIFKHLLRNCLANQSQTLCGASLERGNENLKRSGKPRKSWDEVLLDDRKKLGMDTADPQNRCGEVV